MNLDAFISNAFKEDIGDGDHTTLACIPELQTGTAQLLVKEEGIIAGVELAEKIFHHFDPSLSIRIQLQDGTPVHKGTIVFTVAGKSRSILSCERIVLNCMQRMSGIATLTHRIAGELKEYKTKILDTRKTTPGFRVLEKQAVKTGGGHNHRFGLYDMILIKDNHVDAAGGISQAIGRTQSYLKKTGKNLSIEIEARSLEEVREILAAGGVNRILLDNFSFHDLKKAVELINAGYETEASGNINLENVRQYAACGVDFISMGMLTHSCKSLDLSLKILPV